MYKLAPSILAADFNRLGEQLSEVEKAGVNWLHLDVMDGEFVPSISFGMPVIASIRKESNLFFDVHLMIVEPVRYIEEFAKSGADMIVVHAEACQDLSGTIEQIKAAGCKAGVSLKPATSIDCLDEVIDKVDMILIMTVEPGFGGQSYIEGSTSKIRQLKELVNKRGLSLDIEVDGGIYQSNVDEVLEAGANIIVAGSAVFKGDIRSNVKGFQEAFDRQANKGEHR